MWFPILKTNKIIDLETGGEITAEQLVADSATLAVSDGATSNAATSGVVVVPITEEYSGYTSNATAAIAATLADGVVGQTKIIKLELKATNNMVVTPANFNNGTTITFDASLEVAILKFVGTGWEVIYTNATVA